MSRVLRWFFLVVLVGFALSIMGRLLTVENTQAANDTVEQYSLMFLVIRLTFIAVVWWFWESIVALLLRRSDGTDGNADAIAVYRSKRNTVLALFVLVELFFVQNILGKILGAII